MNAPDPVHNELSRIEEAAMFSAQTQFSAAAQASSGSARSRANAWVKSWRQGQRAGPRSDAT